MNPTLERPLSAPELQLRAPGNSQSFGLLLKASRTLPDQELKALEDELSFHAKSGLVGIRMSRLLLILQSRSVAEAAQETGVVPFSARVVSKTPSMAHPAA